MPDVFRQYYTPSVGVPLTLSAGGSFLFPTQCIGSVCCLLDKGYTPPPFSIIPYPSGTGLRIIFEENPFSSSCVCAIECIGSPTVTPPGTDPEQFCPEQVDHVFDIDLDVVIEGDAIPVLFTFVDELGNSSEISVSSLVYTKPSAPIRRVDIEGSYYYLELGIPFTSVTGTDLRPHLFQYQVEEYIENEENRKVIIDWAKPSTLARPVHITRRKEDLLSKVIRNNVQYGYRIRYRTFFDQASKWSDWTLAKAPDDVQTS